MSKDAIAPRSRIAATGRPYEDARCAGCRQLALLRALRRAGLAVEGGLGCAPPAAADPGVPPGRVARVAGAVEALVRAAALVEEGRTVALLAVADRGPHRAAAVEGALAAAGARVVRVPAEASAADAERIVSDALQGGPLALVALAECARRAEPAAPFAIEPSRCNRCGRCLGLGCVAISDLGFDCLSIDPQGCIGCGLCAPLCRSGAIRSLQLVQRTPCWEPLHRVAPEGRGSDVLAPRAPSGEPAGVDASTRGATFARVPPPRPTMLTSQCWRKS